MSLWAVCLRDYSAAYIVFVEARDEDSAWDVVANKYPTSRTVAIALVPKEDI